jgi:hypothetical protein
MSIDLVAFGPRAEMLAFSEAVEVSTLSAARKLAEEMRDRTKADQVFVYNYRNGFMWFSLSWDDKMNMGMVPVA